jgi:hypothetical protein
MKKHFWVIVLFTSFSCGSNNSTEEVKTSVGETSAVLEKQEPIKNFQDCLPNLNGAIYQYQSDPNYPEEAFILRFTCSTDTLKGEIIGPDPEGEHGLFFFHANLDSLKTDGLNKLEFQFVQGKLYQKQITLTNYNKLKEEDASGASKGKIYYKGVLSGDSLIFKCTSQYYDCYADEMVFKLKK